MLLGLFSSLALGCGGLFTGDGSEVFSAEQQAIFELGDGFVDVEYLVSYGSDQAEFGWVVPVPGAFVELAEGQADRFDDFGWHTAPQPDYHYEKSRGCGGDAKGGALNGATSEPTIVGQGRAGVFDYVALAATDSVGLQTWLADYGWTVGPSGPAIDAYVAEGGWQFVAISLAEDAAPEDGGDGGQTTARIRYEGDQMVFPARMSGYSVAPEQTTTLYVVGDQRAQLTGWAAEELPGGHVVRQWDMTQAIRDLGLAEPTYAEVFADELSEGWVTRFDTVTASVDHVADVQLTLNGGQSPFSPEVNVYETADQRDKAVRTGGCATVGNRSATLVWLGLAGAVFWRRRQAETGDFTRG